MNIFRVGVKLGLTWLKGRTYPVELIVRKHTLDCWIIGSPRKDWPDPKSRWPQMATSQGSSGVLFDSQCKHSCWEMNSRGQTILSLFCFLFPADSIWFCQAHLDGTFVPQFISNYAWMVSVYFPPSRWYKTQISTGVIRPDKNHIFKNHILQVVLFVSFCTGNFQFSTDLLKKQQWEQQKWSREYNF